MNHWITLGLRWQHTPRNDGSIHQEHGGAHEIGWRPPFNETSELSLPNQDRAERRCHEDLSMEERKTYMSGLGMLGWLVSCIRADMAYTYSMIASGMARPTKIILRHLVWAMRCLIHTDTDSRPTLSRAAVITPGCNVHGESDRLPSRGMWLLDPAAQQHVLTSSHA
jgi:hypothetical protein